MIVLVVPGLRADDLTRPELPMLRRLVERGAVGWMNTRTARVPGQKGDPQEAAYLTLGAGARATAGPYARVLPPPSKGGQGGVLTRLKAENARLDHPVPIGALGDMLHAAGLKTIVVGTEDDTGPRRAAWMIAMDAQGRTDFSNTSDYRIFAASIPYDDAPYGLRTNPSTFSYAAGEPAEFQVWVYGDVARADRYAPLCVDTMAENHRAAALSYLNEFLIGLLSIEPRNRLLILSSSPADSAPPGDRLAPILMFGDGVQPGLLTSGSTHRPGLVTNTDFLPTVAAYFGLKPPPGAVGRPMTVALSSSSPPDFRTRLLRLLGLRPTPDTRHPTPELWAALHDRWLACAQQQAAFGGLPTVQFVLALTVIVILDWARKSRIRNPKSKIALVILALPIAQLLLPPVSPAPVWAAGLLLGAVVLGIAVFGAWRPGRAQRAAAALTAGLVVVILLDLAMGGYLLQEAWMSYSVMEGARYYGIGNEYAGAVFAAGLVAAALLLRGERARRWPLALGLLCLLAALMGLPMGGANAGGFLAALIGFGAAGLVWWRGRLRARDLLAVLLAAALLLGALLALDLGRGDAEQTHIARAAGSGGSVLNIITRKAALNASLLLQSPWSLGLLASVVGLSVLWRAPQSGLRTRLTEDRIARGAAAGLLMGAFALLVFNDSGVVAASEALLLTWAGAQVAYEA